MAGEAGEGGVTLLRRIAIVLIAFVVTVVFGIGFVIAGAVSAVLGDRWGRG